MKIVAFVCMVIVLPLLLGEATDWAPWLAERVLRLAARVVAASERDEQLRHWQGELDTLPGRWSKLAFAVGILLRSGTLRAISHRLARQRGRDDGDNADRKKTAGRLVVELEGPLSVVALSVVTGTTVLATAAAASGLHGAVGVIGIAVGMQAAFLRWRVRVVRQPNRRSRR